LFYFSVIDIPNIIFYNIAKNKETKQHVYYKINEHKIGRRHIQMATATIPLKGSASMESKKVSISSKRQITIPQKFFTLLGFNTEAECIMRGNELVLRPVKENTSGEFAEQILADLIRQGYSGEELLEKFKQAQRKVRPAVEAMLAEADRVAESKSGGYSLEDVFGTEDEK
jgi:bifunctional DNA-binding transcriptional regulator/antitoxin component of YhaV-PrlF toxin-antitoxin module